MQNAAVAEVFDFLRRHQQHLCLELDLAAVGARGSDVGDPAGAIAPDGAVKTFRVIVRVDTPEELTSFRHGGILPYVLRRLAKA